MKKRKLPTDWITVNSKTHPDRIYYFNVKTNRTTWIEPTSDKTQTSPEPICKRRKNYDEGEERLRAVTPEYLKEEETTRQQNSQHKKRLSQETKKMTNTETTKEKDTPLMKALREKLLQRKLQTLGQSKGKIKNVSQDNGAASSSKNSSKQAGKDGTIVSSLKRSYAELEKSNKTCSLARSSSLKITKNQPSRSSVNGSKIEKATTLTPQMRVLHDKIHQRNLDATNPDKKTKTDYTSRQRGLEAKNQTTETQESEQNARNQGNINQSKNDIKQNRNTKTKKNLAKERMQKLRKTLNIDKCGHEKIDYSIITEKASSILDKNLPASQYNGSLGSANIYRNVEIRLKRLHNKTLKNAIYEKNVTLNNNDKLQNRQSEKLVINNMTKEKLLEQATREVFYEEMDWEPMKDEDITLEVEVVRTQIKENCTIVTSYTVENAVQLTQPLGTQEKGPLYIVIDTNVFLSNLEIIEKARDTAFKTYPRPFIVIPWTVIRELDYIKDDKSRTQTLRSNARRAISFLNKHFSSKHPRIVGQTREQATKNKEDFSLECPDDEILQCCLQLRELKKSVVLLSYDKNLCTKAMIYDIVALGRHDPLEKIDYLNISDEISNFPTNNVSAKCSILNEELRLSDDIFEDTKTIMKEFLSAIIIKQMSYIYGSDWEMYVIIKPPWTIITALKCAIKHWIAAISDSFHRRAIYILKELLPIFEILPDGGRKLQDVEHTLNKCSDLMGIVNTNMHSKIVTQPFKRITELKSKCLKCLSDIDEKKLHDKIGIAENIQEQEYRAEKAFQCFKQIYSYARDLCGVAASTAGMAFPLNFNPINPSSPAFVKRLQPEITRKVTDLTHNLNKLLAETENSIKYLTLLSLQQDLSTFSVHTGTVAFDVELLDIYYCAKLKEGVLKTGLRQLQELCTHYCALATYT